MPPQHLPTTEYSPMHSPSYLSAYFSGRSLLWLTVVTLSIIAFAPSRVRAEYPKPSPYPKSWELEFQHGLPKRVVVQTVGKPAQAYWYMTYSVTNNTDKEQLFLPAFEL